MSFTDPRLEVKRHTKQIPWTYRELDSLQREIQTGILSGESGRLLLSEVAPVITLGRRTQPGDILGTPEYFNQHQVEIYPTDRGGLATYHGPGQWLLFPVESLEKLTGDPRGVKKAVESLLEVACEVGRQYDSSAHIRTGCEQGVWTTRGKFAAVGVHIGGGVLLHGVSVNGFRTPTSFVGLRPCGLDAPVDYLLGEASEAEFVRLGELLAGEMLKRMDFALRSRTPLNQTQNLL